MTKQIEKIIERFKKEVGKINQMTSREMKLIEICIDELIVNKNTLSADVMPRFTKKDTELNKDAIQIAIAILDWDNYNKELYDSPKDQVTDLYWLIDKLNGA